MVRKNEFWIILIVSVIIIFALNSAGYIDISKFTSTAENKITGLSSLGDVIKRNSNCPQIDVPVNIGGETLPFIKLREYDGWKIAPYDTNTLIGLNFGRIDCHKGNKQGQNTKYLYCGDKSSQTTMAFMEKTFINDDGTVGKTIRQSFVNIYEPIIDELASTLCDEGNEGEFIRGGNLDTGEETVHECGKDGAFRYVFKETICGDDPDKIIEKEFKETMRDIDDWFD